MPRSPRCGTSRIDGERWTMRRVAAAARPLLETPTALRAIARRGAARRGVGSTYASDGTRRNGDSAQKLELQATGVAATTNGLRNASAADGNGFSNFRRQVIAEEGGTAIFGSVRAIPLATETNHG